MIAEVEQSLEQELNPWLAAEARFNEAADRLNLDEGMQKVLRTPAREITVAIPVQTGRWATGSVHRISRAAFHRARSGERRHPIRSRRDAGRSAGARLLDDLEVRGREHSVRRREGRRHLRSDGSVADRTGANHAALHSGNHRFHRARTKTFPRRT